MKAGESIIVRDLIKVYRTGKVEVIALRGVDLAVRQGEIVAIMGPSGSGKTTLLNLIGGLDKPTAGSVIVNGVSVPDMDEGQLVEYRRNGIGFVFQFFNLVPWLNVKQNIELPMWASGKPNSYRERRVKELLEALDLSERRTHRPDELSGGEQQRVAIAAALANDPPVILADEPTGELDTETGSQILSLFKEVNERYGKTEVIVTHDTRVGRIADRCLRIEDGKIVGEETLDKYAYREKEKIEAENRELRQRLQRLTELVGQMSEELE